VVFYAQQACGGVCVAGVVLHKSGVLRC
jgi:hypothetical protein